MISDENKILITKENVDIKIATKNKQFYFIKKGNILISDLFEIYKYNNFDESIFSKENIIFEDNFDIHDTDDIKSFFEKLKDGLTSKNEE